MDTKPAAKYLFLDLETEGLDYPSKLDRGVAHNERLLDVGRRRAEWFFDERSNWPRAQTVPAKSKVVIRDLPTRT